MRRARADVPVTLAAALLAALGPASASGESLKVLTPGTQSVGQPMSITASGVADGSHRLYLYADENRMACALTPHAESIQDTRVFALSGREGEALAAGSFTRTFTYTPGYQLPTVCGFLDSSPYDTPDVSATVRDPVDEYLENTEQAKPSGERTWTLPGALEPLPVNQQSEQEFWRHLEEQNRKEREQAAQAQGALQHASPLRAADGRCRVPRLTGLAVGLARALAQKAGCRLRLAGAAVSRPAIQTIRRQSPGAHRRGRVVTVWVNPLCSGSAEWGPPGGEPLVTRGPTELVSGLFLDGGPHRLRSAPRCDALSGTPGAGTITVTSPGTNTVVASQTVAAGRLARIRLRAGSYAISGTFADALINGQHPRSLAQAVRIPPGATVRQDVVLSIP